MSTTTNLGVALSDEGGIDDAADAFLAKFLPDGDPDAPKKKEPSEDETQGDTDETKKVSKTEKTPTDDDKSTDDSDESPEKEEDEEDDGKKTDKKYVDDDQTYTKIKVGDEEHEVPVSDLKRLYGQEKALTQRSQEVATRRKELDGEAAKYTAGLNALLTRAAERAKPYEGLDFLVLAKDPNVSAEELTALRSEANTRFEEVRFLQSELGNFMGEIQKVQQANLAETAKNSIKQFSDNASPNFIDGWSNKTYNDIRAFSIDAGLDKDIVNNLVDASAIKLLHDAMLYRAGKAKVQTVVKNKTVKKVVKTSRTMDSKERTGKSSDATKALKNHASEGSVDSAANAFLAQWSDGDTE